MSNTFSLFYLFSFFFSLHLCLSLSLFSRIISVAVAHHRSRFVAKFLLLSLYAISFTCSPNKVHFFLFLHSFSILLFFKVFLQSASNKNLKRASEATKKIQRQSKRRKESKKTLPFLQTECNECVVVVVVVCSDHVCLLPIYTNRRDWRMGF